MPPPRSSTTVVLELLHLMESGRVVRVCDYLRLWDALYTPSAPSEIRAVSGMTHAMIPTDALCRIRDGTETQEDVGLATSYVSANLDFHKRALEANLTWAQYMCWKLDAFR